LNLVGVVSEQKAPAISEPQRLSDEDHRVLVEHLRQRDTAETNLFGQVDAWPSLEHLSVSHSGSNSAEVFDWVARLKPDFIVLYGTSVIKPPLLDAFSDRLVNIHLGLSPYYRGSGTNFWPLVEGKPEFVGATLHVVAAKVDAGPILAQVRPEAVASDRAHQLGAKTIMAGAAAMPQVLSDLAAGRIAAQTQDLSRGRVFRRRDFNADAVRSMWRNFDNGMMDAYLADIDARLAAAPILSLQESSP
jgi:methionyl-tRNA formyltransferase